MRRAGRTRSGRAIGVMAEAPIPGRCRTKLLAAYGPEWVAGLYAAMLRDTLDGLQSVDADHYLVFADEAPDGDEARAVLARHVPRPWEIVTRRAASPSEAAESAVAELLARAGEGGVAVLSASDAPSFPTAPLEEALAALGAPTGGFEQRALTGGAERRPITGGAERRPIIVGPSDDGGAVLVAAAGLEPRMFRDLPWGTPAVMPMLRVRLGSALQELPTWYDVDEPSDVLRLYAELRKAPELAPRTAQFLVTRS
jgi:uncharacterized protein